MHCLGACICTLCLYFLQEWDQTLLEDSSILVQMDIPWVAI